MASVEVGQSGSGNASMKVRVNYTPGSGGVTVTSIDAYRDSYGPTTGNATMYFNGAAITTKSMTWPKSAWGNIWSGSAWVGGTSLTITFACSNNNNIKNSNFSTGVFDIVNEYYVGIGSSCYMEIMTHRTYQFPTWSDGGGQDDIVWAQSWGGYWERGGRGYGCAWGGTHGGASLDDAWNIHVYGHGSYIGGMYFYPRIYVVYNANGGSSTPGTQTKYIGSAMYLAGAISRTGYTFNGWTDGYNTWGGSTYLNCHSWNSLSGNPTNEGWGDRTPAGRSGNTIYLTASWTINSYWNDINAYQPESTTQLGLKFDLKTSDGSSWTDLTNEPSGFTKNYGTVATISNIRSNVTGAHYSKNNVTGNAASSFSWTFTTANWVCELFTEWNTYTIKYNANGGSGAPGNQTKTYSKNLTLSSTKPTRVGYNFLGWSTSSTATSASYSAGGTLSTDLTTTNGATITLYAVWQAKGMMTKVSGSWKSADTYINVSGTWKAATVYIKVDGTWKQLK